MFSFDILEILNDKATVRQKETEYIKTFEATNPSIGYNIREDANSKLRKATSEETKKKISEAQVGIPKPEETKQKMSEAAKARPSNRKGIILSKETKLKISESKKGQTHKSTSGWTHSEETKAKMSLSRKGLIPWNKGIKMN